MSTFKPYPADTAWSFRSRASGHSFTTPLLLSWEVNGDPISDNFTPEEITASELWNRWFSQYGKSGPGKVYWFVTGRGVFEGAPFGVNNATGEDFLTHYSWPVHSVTEDRINFARLPVRDKLWGGKHCDKGGFIQQYTGWKPSPLQPLFDAEVIAKAAGLPGH